MQRSPDVYQPIPDLTNLLRERNRRRPGSGGTQLGSYSRSSDLVNGAHKDHEIQAHFSPLVFMPNLTAPRPRGPKVFNLPWALVCSVAPKQPTSPPLSAYQKQCVPPYLRRNRLM